jgi:DNA invertase Pin-like site-specific DNA recombinase
MKAIGYVRVSTADQTRGLSLEAQERAISSEVARRGWELATVVTEARSGKDLRSRPELSSALETLDFAGSGGALVVSRLDRLARSLGDLCDIMDRAEKHGWTLLILDPMVDLSDPFGQCMAQVAGAFAQLERRLISQRQKESVAARKAAGTYKKPQTWITPEAEERIAHLRSDGMSLRGIARQLELEGFDPPTGNRWHPKSIARIAQRASEAA